MSPKRIDISGQKFGKLEALQYLGHKKYSCKCDCGNEIIAFAYNLRNGQVSCGCDRFPDLSGKKFGRLLVISEVRYGNKEKNRNYGYRLWKCKCDCGNYVVLRTTYLTGGDSKSCGCLFTDRANEKRIEPYTKLKNSVYNEYKGFSRRMGRAFELNKEEFFDITSKDCFYCGEKPSNFRNGKGTTKIFRFNGIDRVDSKKGYVKGNIVPCCKNCNYAKRERTVEEFYKWVENVYNFKVKGRKYVKTNEEEENNSYCDSYERV